MTTEIIAIAISLLVSSILTPVFRELALRQGRVDIPNERSSHARPTPRNGGYAILAGLCAAWLISAAYRDRMLLIIGLSIIALAALATVDERSHVDQRIRLLLQILISAVAVIAGSVRLTTVTTPFVELALGPMAILITIFWLTGVLNGYNFMDGLNGIASIEAIVCGSLQAVLLVRAGDRAGAAIAGSAAAAALGFLLYNRRGTVFMGDTGSTTLGFLFAALAVRASREGVSFIAAALPLAPFLLDTLVTLVRRIVLGERFLTAHRSHFYQRLNQQGWPHMSVSLLWGALATVGALVAVSYDRLHPRQQTIALAAVILAHAVVFAIIALRPASPARTDNRETS